MIRRRRRGSTESEHDEAMGLSGWLYTDLMLGLVVVFLGAVVVTAPIMIEDEDGDTVIVTTTTTTTIPVELCTTLYTPYTERNLDLTVRYSASDEELKAEFIAGLDSLYAQLNARPENVEAGVRFDSSATKIGMVLALSSNVDGENKRVAVETRERLFQLLPQIFDNTAFRDSYTTGVGGSQVAFEVFPLIEYPC